MVVHDGHKYVILVRPEGLWPILAGQGHWELDPGDMVGGPITVVYGQHMYTDDYQPPLPPGMPVTVKGTGPWGMGPTAIFEGVVVGGPYILVGRNDLHNGPVEVLGTLYLPPTDKPLGEVHLWNDCVGNQKCDQDPLCNCKAIHVGNQGLPWMPGVLFMDTVVPFYQSLGTTEEYIIHEEELIMVLENMVDVERDKQSDAVIRAHGAYLLWDADRRQPGGDPKPAKLPQRPMP